ncbi:Uncharacterised protein [uncultured archaeon]|nr:Uncharacterised protein [uncultured archaeon]
MANYRAPRNPEWVARKLAESEFFFNKLSKAGANVFELSCYFSAFISSARSVTYALQHTMEGVEGFDAWYAKKRMMLDNSNFAKIMASARNDSVHRGDPLISGGRMYRKNGKLKFETFIDPNWKYEIKDSSRVYLKLLKQLVKEWKYAFRDDIAPYKHLTVKKLEKMGMSLEDLEERLGFPRGWTAVPGFRSPTRLRLLKRYL